MEVVILCGGQGTRIRDVSEDMPKPMIPIGGRPILWHIMKTFAEHGFNRFVLCLGYKSWAIKKFFLDYHLAHSDITVSLESQGHITLHEPGLHEDWQITLAETGLDTMTGGRVKRIEKYLQGDHFFMTYGDGLADVNLQDLARFHKSHGRLATVTAVYPPGRFGEMDLVNGRVAQFAEKPQLSRGCINGGFFVLDRSILRRLSFDPSLVFEQQPLVELAQDGELMAYEHRGFWHPMDSSRDYRYLNDLWDQRQAPWCIWDQRRMRQAA